MIALRPTIRRIVRAMLARLRRHRAAIAAQAWTDACAGVAEAKRRHDTRAVHVAEQRARRAVAQQLAAELGRVGR